MTFHFTMILLFCRTLANSTNGPHTPSDWFSQSWHFSQPYIYQSQESNIWQNVVNQITDAKNFLMFWCSSIHSRHAVLNYSLVPSDLGQLLRLPMFSVTLTLLRDINQIFYKKHSVWFYLIWFHNYIGVMAFRPAAEINSLLITSLQGQMLFIKGITANANCAHLVKVVSGRLLCTELLFLPFLYFIN